MGLPPSYASPRGKVCKLKKAYYGLKQSPIVRFGKISRHMKMYDFKQELADHVLFYGREGEDNRISYYLLLC